LTLPLLSASAIRAQVIPADRFYSVLVFNQYSAFGARAAGMGNAYTAIANDLTAIYWNPAALARTGDIAFYISGEFLERDLDADSFSGDTFLDWRIASESLLKFDYFGANFRWSGLKENVHIGFGIGKHGIFPGNEHFLLVAYHGPGYSWQGEFSSGVSTSITGAVSIDLSESLFLGAAFHFWSTEDERVSIQRQQMIGSGLDTVFSQNRQIFDHARINFGFLYTGIPDMNLGLNLKLPYTLGVRPSYIEAFDQLVAAGYTYLQNVKIKFPLALTAGLSYSPVSGLILAFDYNFDPWSQIQLENPIREKKPDFDMHTWHMGMEYNWQSGFWRFPVRIGYYSQPTQIRAGNGQQFRIPVFTTGGAVQYKKFRLDLAFEWMPIAYTLTRFRFDPDHALDNVALKGDFFKLIFDFSLAADYKE
jgi:opacity protein-like surface antigen